MNTSFVNHKVIAYSFISLILVIGLVIGLYLVSHPTFFKPKAFDLPSTYQPKVLLVIFNPILKTKGNRKLTNFENWNDPDNLSSQIAATFNQVSGGMVNYQMSQTVELDEIPVKQTGFQYSEQDYLNCLSNSNSCYRQDEADYLKILNSVDACGKRNRGEIDEVWMWGGPYFGFFESNLTGPNAFFYNSPPTAGSTCQKLLPIMGFNYQVGLDNAIHDFGHRLESTMIQVDGYSRFTNPQGWYKFSRLDMDAPGLGGCGTAHFPVNGVVDYDYSNETSVRSSCADFKNYPNLTGNTQNVNCDSWGCNQLGYFQWMFSNLPRSSGVDQDGKLNNWWAYLVDPQNTIFGTSSSPSSLNFSPSPSPSLATNLAGLSISQVVTPQSIPSNGQFTTIITEINNGTMTISSHKIRNPLPSGITFISVDPKCSLEASDITCLIPQLPPGSQVSFSFTAKAVGSTGNPINNIIHADSDNQADNIQQIISIPVAN